MELNEKRDWSELLPDLLHLISKKLPDLCDYIRFRAVCKCWCSAAPLSDPPSQFPWILMHDPGPDSKLCFYSLSCNKFHKMHIPKSHGKMLMGPAKHYIFAIDCDDSYPSLLNPLTMNEVPLPPIKNFQGHGSICMAPNGPKSIHNSELIAICRWNKQYGKICTIGLWRPGDAQWTEIDKYSDSGTEFYYDGMYYVYNYSTSVIEVIDVRSGVRAPSVLPPETDFKFNYFIMSCEGVLGIHCYPGWPCKIYRLIQGSNCPRWMEVQSIGDQMIFLSGRYTGFYANVGDSNQFKGNCIYLLSNHQDRRFSVDVYDIEVGKWEVWQIFPCDDIECDQVLSWFLPNFD